ncbi:MAG: ABC transporter permease [Candidatus Melainabacteria bacterium]|jgi:ABC-2 type transport system permease protein|nr:ABC transporter permease [Candidatus Melainabacteria bacterium]
MPIGPLVKTTRLGALTRKEMRQILRDRQLISILFMLPLIQLCIYGYSLSPDVNHLRLGIIDYSQSPTSRGFVSALVENEVFDRRDSGDSEEVLGEKVRGGKLDVGIVIPPELERNFKSNKVTEIQVLLDGVDANTAGIANAYINQIVMSFDRLIRTGSQLPIQRTAPQVSFVYNQGLVSNWFFVPGVIALVLNLVSTLVSSAAVVREKDSGTLEQLLMTPVSSFQILTAKVIPLSLLLLINVSVSLFLSTFLFHVPFRGNLLVFFSVSLLYIIVGISIGIFLAAISENQRQTLLTSFFINLPVIQLSGAISPLESMPPVFQWLSLLDPLRYYCSAVRAILLKGAGFDAIWRDVLALAVFAVVLLWLSSSRFREQLK